jgi:tRNA threonylcarbamoyladenosine biosynthesis protein TsaB
MIVTIRTDKPEAEVGLFRANGTEISYQRWAAHRALSATLLSTIRDQLMLQKAEFSDISGVVVYRGPGSFTGLRIGVTVANSLAYALGVPIVGESGESWIQRGCTALPMATSTSVLPDYGADAHITKPQS